MVIQQKESIEPRESAQGQKSALEVSFDIQSRIARVFLTLPDERMYGGVLDIVLEAMESLRESERRFREILEHLRLIAVTIDNSGNITFCNDYLLSPRRNSSKKNAWRPLGN